MNRLAVLLLVSVLLVITNGVKAQKGVSFYKGKFEKAEQEARDAKKPMLLYFRLKGTEPCEVFEKEILSNDTLGDLYNGRLVNVQVEADKKNKELIGKYKVTEVPLIIWLDDSGNEAYRIVGDIPVSVLSHVGKVMLGELPSLEDLLESTKTSNYSLESIQTLLSEALSFLPVLSGETFEYWTGEIRAMYQKYLNDKNMEDMVNATDFRILTSYLEEAKLFDPVFDFILKNYDRYKTVVPEKEVADFLMDRNMELIGRLTYSGNEAYKEAVARVGNDMARVYARVESFVGIDTVMSYQADADYWLHGKQDQDAYVDVKNDYFKVLGNKLRWQDLYSAVNDLRKAINGHFTEKSFKVCMAWIDVIEAQQNIENGVRLWVHITRGDCYFNVGDRDNAKGSYNQAYIIAMQLNNTDLQAFLKQKIAALDKGDTN